MRDRVSEAVTQRPGDRHEQQQSVVHELHDEPTHMILRAIWGVQRTAAHHTRLHWIPTAHFLVLNMGILRTVNFWAPPSQVHNLHNCDADTSMIKPPATAAKLNTAGALGQTSRSKTSTGISNGRGGILRTGHDVVRAGSARAFCCQPGDTATTRGLNMAAWREYLCGTHKTQVWVGKMHCRPHDSCAVARRSVLGAKLVLRAAIMFNNLLEQVGSRDRNAKKIARARGLETNK